MRYIRMYKGSEDGAPGVTLYEVDAGGWVHRQLQVHADGVRFSPEDILLRRPVSVSYMVKHPDAEEITHEEFELCWAEFDHRRRFRERLPNPWRAWQGRMPNDATRPERSLRWEPSGATPGERVSVAFLGGEPLVNRPVVRAATEYAVAQAAAAGVDLRLSITTNGTLIDVTDVDFFEHHGFAVTISIDGGREAHDTLRPFRNGRGSYDRVLARTEPLLATQHRMQVSARVTVTPSNLAIRSSSRRVSALVASPCRIHVSWLLAEGNE